MQLTQLAGLGIVVIGGLLAVLLRSDSSDGMSNTMTQLLAGVVVGLLGAVVILIWTTDLVPDNVEWVGTVILAIGAVALLVAVRIRTGR